MPSLNATLNIVAKSSFTNETLIIDTQPSGDWYSNPYIVYVIRVVAVGGLLFAIRHACQHYRSHSSGKDPQSLEAEDQHVAVGVDIELPDIVAGPADVDLDLETGLGLHAHLAPITRSSNRIGVKQGGDRKGPLSGCQANRREEVGEENANGSAIDSGTPST